VVAVSAGDCMPWTTVGACRRTTKMALQGLAGRVEGTRQERSPVPWQMMTNIGTRHDGVA